MLAIEALETTREESCARRASAQDSQSARSRSLPRASGRRRREALRRPRRRGAFAAHDRARDRGRARPGPARARHARLAARRLRDRAARRAVRVFVVRIRSPSVSAFEEALDRRRDRRAAARARPARARGDARHGQPYDLHYRLRPTLRETAAGLLAVRRGIELDREPDRGARALGDETWQLVRPDREPPDDRAAAGSQLTLAPARRRVAGGALVAPSSPGGARHRRARSSTRSSARSSASARRSSSSCSACSPTATS